MEAPKEKQDGLFDNLILIPCKGYGEIHAGQEWKTNFRKYMMRCGDITLTSFDKWLSFLCKNYDLCKHTGELNPFLVNTMMKHKPGDECFW